MSGTSLPEEVQKGVDVREGIPGQGSSVHLRRGERAQPWEGSRQPSMTSFESRRSGVKLGAELDHQEPQSPA